MLVRVNAVFLAIFFVAAAARADLTIVQSIQPMDPLSKEQPPAQKMVLTISGDKLRLDSGEVSSIIRRDTKKTISLVHAEHGYAVMPHLASAPRAASADEEPVNTIKTGKTDTINGFRCEEFHVEQANGTKLDAWITNDAEALKAMETVKVWQTGEYADLLSGMGFKRQGIGGAPGLPIRTTVLDSKGLPTVTVEVKQVDNRPVKADIFEPPSDYREIPMDSTLAPGESSDLDRRLKEMEAATGKIQKPDPNAKP